MNKAREKRFHRVTSGAPQARASYSWGLVSLGQNYLPIESLPCHYLTGKYFHEDELSLCGTDYT